MLKKVAILLEMIKFEHTVFALPFALMGAFLAQRGVPGVVTFGWLLLAMIGARTSAMGFNRIVDRKFDQQNPRTAERALPAGTVQIWEAWVMVVAASVLFFYACYNLNTLTLLLSPLALALALFYSFTKRFTWLCHVILGVALAFAPLGGWVAVKGTLVDYPFVLSLAVLFWVAGFDAVYACLDVDFDNKTGLHSLPVRFGRKNTFKVAVFFHIVAFSSFIMTGIITQLHYFYYLGIVMTGGAMFYQHFVIYQQGMSKIQLSFFTMNGLISLSIFVATWLALVV